MKKKTILLLMISVCLIVPNFAYAMNFEKCMGKREWAAATLAIGVFFAMKKAYTFYGKKLLGDKLLNNKNLEEVERFISGGANVNIVGYDDITPLHFAAENKDIAIAKTLIKAGANIDLKDIIGRTPLVYAIKRGNIDGVKLLLESGAALNAKDVKGRTPLHHAAGKKDAGTIKLLLSQVSVPGVLGSSAIFTKDDETKEVLDLKNLIFLFMFEDLSNFDAKDYDVQLDSLRSCPAFNDILENPSKNLRNFCIYKHLEWIKNFIAMKDNDNKTALDIAREKNKYDCVQLLEVVGNAESIEDLPDDLRLMIEEGLKEVLLKKIN